MDWWAESRNQNYLGRRNLPPAQAPPDVRCFVSPRSPSLLGRARGLGSHGIEQSLCRGYYTCSEKAIKTSLTRVATENTDTMVPNLPPLPSCRSPVQGGRQAAIMRMYLFGSDRASHTLAPRQRLV